MLRNAIIMIKDTTAALGATIKANGWPIFGIIATLLSPIKWMMALVAIFIIADTIFGIWSARKLGMKLKSRKFARFISKMLVYQCVVITAFALDTLLLGEFFLLFISIPMVVTKLAALALIIAEIFSINEKLTNVNEGQGIWFHFTRLLKIAKFIKKEADELTNDINSEPIV
jgi:hypothetical protein